MTNTYKHAAISAFVLLLAGSSMALAESAGQYIDDATITTKVKAALIADTNLKAIRVNVETNQGTVQLSGVVDNKQQESEAIKVTNRINGVKSVKDLITVQTSEEQ